MKHDMQVRAYLLRNLRLIGATIIASDSDTVTISTTGLSHIGAAEALEQPKTLIDGSAEVRRERLINLDGYEHDVLSVRRPVANTDQAIDEMVNALDWKMDTWEHTAKASCASRRAAANEERRRSWKLSQQAEDDHEGEPGSHDI